MWKTLKIGDVCDLMTGGTPNRKKPEYFSNGHIKWLVSGDINQREIFDCSGRITEAGLSNSSAKFLPEDSVLIALNGQGKTRGTVALLRTKATCNQSLVAIHPKQDCELDTKFLFYVLDGMYDRIRRITGDAGNDRRGLNMPLIRNIYIPYPPLAEQRRIVAKLDAAFAEIDEALLSINHKYILAEQLVSRTISSVFSQIDDSELKHTTLSEVTYTAGRIGWKGLTKKEYVEEGRLFLSVHGLNYGKFVDFRDAFRITQARYDESPEIMLKQGDILLCKDGAGIGKLGVVGKLPEPATINSSLLLIRPSEQLTTDYIYYSLLSSEFQSVIQSKIDGATTPHLYQRDISQFQFSLPSLQIQMEITEKISSALFEIQKIQNSFASNITNYESLKKALLAQELKSEAA